MTYPKWKQLVDEGYSSDAISLLQFLKAGEIIDQEHVKTSGIYSLLLRKGLVLNEVLTPTGEELLEGLDLDTEIPVAPKKEDKFEEWWKMYPATDAFTYQGRTFPGTQSKR